MDYRYGSHTVFQIEYHFVWVTKYRYKVLTAKVRDRVTEEMIKNYLEHHFEPNPNDDFKTEP